MIFFSCSEEKLADDKLFTTMPSSVTGIDFINQLEFDREFNIYTYRNFYNGGGVAIGDINNDSLPDIYLSANMGPNKLYLNQGNFSFKDITEEAGVAGNKTWSTGVTMADVNGDGLLDIYVCNSGDLGGKEKQNELFINNGDLTFNEASAQYGIDDRGYSTHAVFFDYDKDNDLDLYLLNNSYQAIGSFNLRKNMREVRDAEGGDKLFRNEGGKYVDVSEKAGIYGSVIGFGLGVTVGDINLDGWPDIYVSNDFFEKDYIYINNGDGTFSEKMEDYLSSISVASMGADMADINNDCNPDIFVTEMLPGEDRRLKTKTTFEDWDKYQYSLKNDYYHQFTRNMLHVNNGDGSFSEIGRMNDVHATDWSWGALISDYDNDGFKDLYVTNGIYQDLTDQDFLNYISNEEVMKSIIKDNKVDYAKLIDAIPSERISNYAFRNKGSEGFENMASDWGLAEPSHSNGAAYGDLDNDGDLDLVVNNVNMPLFVYRNNSSSQENRYIQFSFSGIGGNTKAIGTKVTIFTGNEKQYIDYMPMKGFQSSMDYIAHFGLGKVEKVDSVLIVWPDNTFIKKYNLTSNLRYNIAQEGNAIVRPFTAGSSPKYFSDISHQVNLPYTHIENNYVDFDRDRLLYLMRSTEGPFAAVDDWNLDGLDDIFIGGARNQPPSLMLQSGNGTFRLSQESFFEADKNNENLQLLSFDIDGDKDNDIYACSGGMEFTGESSGLKDKTYINNGRGSFTRSEKPVLSRTYMNTSTVAAHDMDQDGDEDLFIGERLKPFAFGVPCNGYLLRNDGKGNFTDVSIEIAPALKEIGMIRDALWADLDSDGNHDLVIIGEFMKITALLYQNGKYVDKSDDIGFKNSEGWWNTIEAADLDNDGDIDLVAGNHGLNSRFRTSVDRPLCMHVNDFDQNGSIEQIICLYEGDKSYPMPLRHDLIRQLPQVKKKYLSYNDYVNQTMEDIFTVEQRKSMLTLFAKELESSVYINNGGVFTRHSLPRELQQTPLYALHLIDVNKDGILDIVAGGNLYRVKPEIGRYDSGRGFTCLGNGDGSFTYISNAVSGFTINGEMRDIQEIKIKGKDCLLVTRNNDSVIVLEILNR
jgi:hypothetical protein